MEASARLRPWFEDYAAHHRTAGNQATHLVGIPILMVSILGLLSRFVLLGDAARPWTRFDAGSLLWLFAVLWYLWLDWRLAVPFALVGAGAYLLGALLPIAALWILFVVGWILQFVGHLVYEKQQPAFFRNLAHLLIGPLWVFAKLARVSR